MSTLQETASKLADDTIKIMEKSGEDRLHYEVADLLGKSSQTLEEAYLTEVRVRLAAKQARGLLRKKVEELTKTAAPKE